MGCSEAGPSKFFCVGARKQAFLYILSSARHWIQAAHREGVTWGGGVCLQLRTIPSEGWSLGSIGLPTVSAVGMKDVSPEADLGSYSTGTPQLSVSQTPFSFLSCWSKHVAFMLALWCQDDCFTLSLISALWTWTRRKQHGEKSSTYIRKTTISQKCPTIFH